jgi:hypothetical protein
MYDRIPSMRLMKNASISRKREYMLDLGFSVVWLTNPRLLSPCIGPNQRCAKRYHRQDHKTSFRTEGTPGDQDRTINRLTDKMGDAQTTYRESEHRTFEKIPSDMQTNGEP